MKVLFATSEAMPYIKSGGLGDVAGSLPKELKKLKVNIRVVLPFYRDIPERFRKEAEFLKEIYVPLGWRNQYCGIYRHKVDGVTFYLLGNEYYFNRKGTYGQYDDGERFAFFSKACLEIIRHIDFIPDIIHCNDWHTGLVPLYLKTLYKDDILYKDMKTLYTIHNIEYQGMYGKNTLSDVFGIGEWDFHYLEYDGGYNIMKGAIQTADMLTTVSRTYAEEIMYPFYSKGLHHILQLNSYKIKGIVNGIDTDVYNPMTDKNLIKNYSKDDWEGKKDNKTMLQEFCGLPKRVDIPIIAMISRLTGHKGIDLVGSVIEEILNKDLQVVILGQGESTYENLFTDMEKKYPDKFKAFIAFSSELASKIYAGGDIFLMPSRSEPCGLAQMIAMAYGTIPVVRETGGLKDTVIPYDPISKKGNGFTFYSYDPYDMMDTISRVLTLYHNKESWQTIIQNAFSSDFSWRSSAREYKKTYISLLM